MQQVLKVTNQLRKYIGLDPRKLPISPSSHIQYFPSLVHMKSSIFIMEGGKMGVFFAQFHLLVAVSCALWHFVCQAPHPLASAFQGSQWAAEKRWGIQADSPMVCRIQETLFLTMYSLPPGGKMFMRQCSSGFEKKKCFALEEGPQIYKARLLQGSRAATPYWIPRKREGEREGGGRETQSPPWVSVNTQQCLSVSPSVSSRI